MDTHLLRVTGKQIPGDTALIAHLQFQTDAQAIIVIEKVRRRCNTASTVNATGVSILSEHWSLCAQDAVFLQLSEDRFFETVLPSVLITAKGMPDLSTRAFLHRLHSTFPQLPVLGEGRCSATLCRVIARCAPCSQLSRVPRAGLVDFNPSGVVILSVYKFGSFRGGVEAPRCTRQSAQHA